MDCSLCLLVLWSWIDWCGWTSPRRINRIIYSLEVLVKDPTRLHALRTLQNDFLVQNQYTRFLSFIWYNIPSLEKEREIRTQDKQIYFRDNVQRDLFQEYCAQLLCDYRLVRDLRWTLGVGLWTIVLSILVSYIVNHLITTMVAGTIMRRLGVGF